MVLNKIFIKRGFLNYLIFSGILFTNVINPNKSFALNHKRNTSHFYVNKMNYKTFVSDFYNFSTRVLGLNANPLGINTDNFWYNADRFLREAGFFENASPKKVFSESSYYKRRELVV